MAVEIHAQGLLNANLCSSPWGIVALVHSIYLKNCPMLQTLFDVFPPPSPDVGAIALGDSLTLLPWHLGVNLGTEDDFTSVFVHPRQKGG